MIGHTSGFFGAPENQTDQQNKKPVFIDLGGEQFQAAAIALIDYLIITPKINESTLKKILGSLYYYFPQYIVKEPYITSNNRIKTLINTARKSELIASIAYILRQLTVDELYRDPLNLNYRTIFEGLTPTTPKDHLRSPHTQLSVRALRALEQVLGLHIKLLYTEPEKELGLNEGYIANTEAVLIIQIIGSNYYPKVQNKQYFSHIGSISLTINPPSNQEGFMADILTAIAKDNESLLSAYQHLRATLLSMNAAGELSREQLTQLYIALIPLQINNESFLLELDRRTSPVITETIDSSEHRITNLLVSTLASWVISNTIRQEQLFEKIENTQSPALSIK